MRRRLRVRLRLAAGFLIIIAAMLLLPPDAGRSGEPRPELVPFSWLSDRIPPRPRGAMTGTQFMQRVAGLEGPAREEIIVAELLSGNVPQFLRKLRPVHLDGRLADGRAATVTAFAMPDYLAIGSDEDFVRIPMSLPSAARVAREFGFSLPTPKLVDAIFDQAEVRLAPQPLPPGPWMRSSEYYARHNQMVEQQLRDRGAALGQLVSGDKKDVVLTNALARHPSRVAIYGWHRASGAPIQPLSTVHGINYADYSHGIRLLSEAVVVDGRVQALEEALADPREARLLSGEGALAAACFPSARRWSSLMAPPFDSGGALRAASAQGERSAALVQGGRSFATLCSADETARQSLLVLSMVLQQRKPRW